MPPSRVFCKLRTRFVFATAYCIDICHGMGTNHGRDCCTFHLQTSTTSGSLSVCSRVLPVCRHRPVLNPLGTPTHATNRCHVGLFYPQEYEINVQINISKITDSSSSSKRFPISKKLIFINCQFNPSGLVDTLKPWSTGVLSVLAFTVCREMCALSLGSDTINKSG